MFTQQELRQQAADVALKMLDQLAEPNLILGIGTGSTTDLFIDGLARLKKPLKGAVASSERSAKRLKAQGIRVLDLNEVDTLPLYVDGADEIDAHLHLMKGGGGAHTREKIVASVAQCFVCIVDESKLVDCLGHHPLPIEVIPMACAAVKRKAIALGGRPVVRQATPTAPDAHSALQQPMMTDNGNIIIDVWGLTIDDAPSLEMQINNWPGVVTCGLFAHPGADIAFLATQQGIRQLTR